jgi:tetratricopeptide (TPR) repeat protein
MDGYVMLGEAMMAESWIYLSSVGFFNLFFVIKKRWARLSNMLILFMTIFFTFLTFINNNYWRNNIIFYENILEHSIARNYIRKNLISEYIQIGLFEKALVEIKKLSVYYPEDKDLFLLHGHYYYSTKRIPMAIEKYNMVLKKNEDFCAYYSLSLCYEKLGQLDDAIGYALKAVNMNPYYKLALIKLGDLYKKKTQILLTKRYYQKALEIDPDDKILKEKIRNAE